MTPEQAFYAVACAFLYRWGGGGFAFLPPPFCFGWKGARRYLLPLYIAMITSWWPQMVVLSMILHFNLGEIQARRWDDIACYGLAQAWCFAAAGPISGLIGAWWILGCWLSNIGIFGRRLDWFFVEISQGIIIGLVTLNIFN